VKLSVYDVSGRSVRRLIDGPVGTGRHEVSWDGRGRNGSLPSSGVYLARIEIGSFVATQKLTMIR
jgi:flagellar hook assembly protein FlgD